MPNPLLSPVLTLRPDIALVSFCSVHALKMVNCVPLFTGITIAPITLRTAPSPL